MTDVNYPLRKAYKTALDAVGIPVYYQYAPDDETAAAYIVFSGINSTDDSTKNSADTDTAIQVKIHTWADKYNPGLNADTYAGLVYDNIYSVPQMNLDLSADGLQIVSTIMQSDVILDYGTIGNKVYIDRVITFKHKIYIQ